jgi:serine O-acetyltransferase
VQVRCVCEGAGLRAAFREDLDRYTFAAEVGRGEMGATGLVSPRWGALLEQGLWATTAYRICHYARYRRHSRSLRLMSRIFQRIVLTFTAIDISAEAHIGPGLWIPHVGYIVIGPVRVGRNCEIFHGVTLGARESFMVKCSPRLPTLGDRVWVGPGAVVAGEVTVGDDAVVGANSLVVHDVPSRGVVLGVPARLVSRRGSFAQVTYRGADEDEERNAALAADPEADRERTR